MPRRSERHAALQLLAALLASCHHLAAAVQTCGSVDALTRAAGTGLADDAAALSALDSSPSTGLIYLPAGAAFLLASPLTLRKPLLGEAGAVLVVRAPLMLLSQPDHPPVPLFDVQGVARAAGRRGCTHTSCCQGCMHSRCPLRRRRRIPAPLQAPAASS